MTKSASEDCRPARMITQTRVASLKLLQALDLSFLIQHQGSNRKLGEVEYSIGRYNPNKDSFVYEDYVRGGSSVISIVWSRDVGEISVRV